MSHTSSHWPWVMKREGERKAWRWHRQHEWSNSETSGGAFVPVAKLQLHPSKNQNSFFLFPFLILFTGSWAGPNILPRALCRMMPQLPNMWNKVLLGLPYGQITFASKELFCMEAGFMVAWEAGAQEFCLVFSDQTQTMAGLLLLIPSSLNWEICLDDLWGPFQELLRWFPVIILLLA